MLNRLGDIQKCQFIKLNILIDPYWLVFSAAY
jgi:hypothetical protein